MALPAFENEAEFRTKWVGPFLSKLGFILPKHVHGVGEQGKDFYFADHDKFGHLRFYAAQVKHGNIGSGRTEIDQLISQVRRSFNVSLKFHKGAHEQRISGVYIMTSGRISDQAREDIHDFCRAERFGENVFYLDGETLDNMERYARYDEDKTVRQQLVALMREAIFNLSSTEVLMRTALNGKPLFSLCRTYALEDCLRTPLPEEMIRYDSLSGVWIVLSQINQYASTSKLPMRWKDQTIQAFQEWGRVGFEFCCKIRDQCDEAIKQLDEKYNLVLDVECPEDSSDVLEDSRGG